MREVFKQKRFNVDAVLVVDAAVRVSDEYMEQGYSVTVRQLYYQMIAQDLFPENWVDFEYNVKQGFSGIGPR